jgi:hypothetical protein
MSTFIEPYLGPRVRLSPITSAGTFPVVNDTEKSFDSQTQVKQFTCLAPQFKKRPEGRFLNWGATGNRTQIEGSTNLSVNRYTITPICLDFTQVIPLYQKIV